MGRLDKIRKTGGKRSGPAFFISAKRLPLPLTALLTALLALLTAFLAAAVFTGCGDIGLRGIIDDVTSAYEWKQVDKLTGSGGEEFGNAVAISGNHLVIGAHYNSSAQGTVYFYKYDGKEWLPNGSFSGSAGGELFGQSVDIEGPYAVIGASLANSGIGEAEVYYNDGSWNLQDTITPSDGANGDRFGHSVGISADKAVIGAYQHNSSAGAAYTFHRSGTSWTQHSKLVASTGEDNDYFGYAVDICNNYAVCGAYQDDDLYTGAGSVYAYYWSGSVWGDGGVPAEETAQILASDGTADDLLGWSVSIDYSTVNAVTHMLSGAVGRPAAYIYERSGIDWKQTILNPGEISGGDHFGSAVDISENRAVIGAKNDDDRGTDSGSAFIYARRNDTWEQEGEILLGSDIAAGDNFGIAVAIDGSFAAVGASKHSGGNGAVYIFKRYEK